MVWSLDWMIHCKVISALALSLQVEFLSGQAVEIWPLYCCWMWLLSVQSSNCWSPVSPKIIQECCNDAQLDLGPIISRKVNRLFKLQGFQLKNITNHKYRETALSLPFSLHFLQKTLLWWTIWDKYILLSLLVGSLYHKYSFNARDFKGIILQCK